MDSVMGYGQASRRDRSCIIAVASMRKSRRADAVRVLQRVRSCRPPVLGRDGECGSRLADFSAGCRRRRVPQRKRLDPTAIITYL